MKATSRHTYLLRALLLGVSFLCTGAAASPAGESEQRTVPLAISSPSFQHDGIIPARYTCDGPDVSPALVWSGVPSEAKSLVLIVDDPDAPRMTWVHWVLYNISPRSDGLPENVAEGNLPAGTLQGLNSWQRLGYGGPCPPGGTHRYFHKLYALDTVLPDLGRPTRSTLEKAMQGHVIAQAELLGRYRRH